MYTNMGGVEKGEGIFVILRTFGFVIISLTFQKAQICCKDIKLLSYSFEGIVESRMSVLRGWTL